MLSNWKICFNVFNIQNYDKVLCRLNEVMKLCGERPVLTFQFDVSTLQKQLRSVIQIHLDHSANLGSFLLNVCVTISHINKF